MSKPDPCQRQACAIQKCLQGITNLLKPFILLNDIKIRFLLFENQAFDFQKKFRYPSVLHTQLLNSTTIFLMCHCYVLCKSLCVV